MNPEAHEALSRMPDAELNQLLLRLGAYALSVSRSLRWRTRNPAELPGGETTRSIVSKAIEKMLSGERKWDPQVCPHLEEYLMDVIDSMLNHLATSRENRNFEAIQERYDETGDPLPERIPPPPPPGAEWISHPSIDTEAKAIAEERARMEEQITDTLISESQGDVPLKKVLESIFDGCDTPRAIAEKTGLSREEVYNAAKRLDRKIRSIRKRFVVSETPVPPKGSTNVH